MVVAESEYSTYTDDVTEATNYTTDTVIPAIEDAYNNGYKINMLLNMNGVYDMAQVFFK